MGTHITNGQRQQTVCESRVNQHSAAGQPPAPTQPGPNRRPPGLQATRNAMARPAACNWRKNVLASKMRGYLCGRSGARRGLCKGVQVGFGPCRWQRSGVGLGSVWRHAGAAERRRADGAGGLGAAASPSGSGSVSPRCLAQRGGALKALGSASSRIGVRATPAEGTQRLSATGRAVRARRAPRPTGPALRAGRLMGTGRPRNRTSQMEGAAWPRKN